MITTPAIPSAIAPVFVSVMRSSSIITCASSAVTSGDEPSRTAACAPSTNLIPTKNVP
jgi:hypothetical protein